MQRKIGQLILIRHGESLQNAARKGKAFLEDEKARESVKGFSHDNAPLSDLGKRQADETGKALLKRGLRPRYIMHSPYLRAKQTAEAIKSAHPKEYAPPLQQHHVLRERDPGILFGMTMDEVAKHFPWADAYWKSMPPFLATPIGGENLATVVDRLAPFVEQLTARIEDRTLLIVSHGRAIWCMRYILEDWDYNTVEVYETPNCGVTIYERPLHSEWELKEKDSVLYSATR